MVFSIYRMSTIQDRFKNSYTPCRCTVKLLKAVKIGARWVLQHYHIWFSCVSGLHARLKILRIEFDSLGNHKQGDATVVRFRNREDKKPKCKDELLQPWTTKNEWYEFHKLERSQVVVKIGLVAQRKSKMLLTSRSGFQNSPSPRSPETTGNPHSQYGSRSVKPVKWGKIALVVEWLAHIPDKNEKKVQFLPRVQNLKCGIRYWQLLLKKGWWVWKRVEKGTSQTHIDRFKINNIYIKVFSVRLDIYNKELLWKIVKNVGWILNLKRV